MVMARSCSAARGAEGGQETEHLPAAQQSHRAYMNWPQESL